MTSLQVSHFMLNARVNVMISALLMTSHAGNIKTENHSIPFPFSLRLRGDDVCVLHARHACARLLAAHWLKQHSTVLRERPGSGDEGGSHLEW